MKIKVIRTLRVALTDLELETVMVALDSLNSDPSYVSSYVIRPDVRQTADNMRSRLQDAIHQMGGLNV